MRTACGGTLAQEPRRPYLEHLTRTGLLQSRRVALGDDFQVYAVPPDAGAERRQRAALVLPAWSITRPMPFHLPAEALGRYLDSDAADGRSA